MKEPHPVHQPQFRSVAIAAIATFVIVAACTRGGAGTASSAASPGEATVSPTATLAASQPAEPTSEPSAEPTSDLGPFSCDFPMVGGSADRSQFTDVRVGEHVDYDRVVFQFDAGVPAFTLREVSPPFTEDPSGLPLAVDGASVWQIVFQGGTAVTPDGTQTYTGETDFTPGFDKLVELVEGGDFEAVSTWYIGLSEDSCARLITLDDPSRLVIDIEH